MKEIAIKILLGDRAKYFGLVFGVTFATLLMAQQSSIFIGLMSRTASTIYDVSEADIWVMDPRVRYIEEVEPLRDIELTRVRSVPGVEWAVPFYKGLSIIRMANGLSQQVQLIGVDNTSLVGICPKMVMGQLNSVQKAQSAMIDSNGYSFIWSKQALQIGREIELNDNRLVINAICEASPTFLTFPIIYVSYNTAKKVTPPTRNKMSFILVKAAKNITPTQLTQNINQKTGLQALTSYQFAWRSIHYILERTGIPINFGITIFLGILIGGAIIAQTFYIFVIENLRQFATMKAIGFTNKQLLSIVLLQAGIVAGIGYSIGIGLTALFFKLTAHSPALKGFLLHWQVIAGVGVIILVITLLSILFSLNRVFKLDPAVVFRG